MDTRRRPGCGAPSSPSSPSGSGSLPRIYPGSATRTSRAATSTCRARRRPFTRCRSVGVTRARVVGHDIGLMVAYAYAAQFAAEVDKLAVMDEFLPGWRAGRPCTRTQASGRERTYFEHFWNDFAADKKRSIPAAD